MSMREMHRHFSRAGQMKAARLACREMAFGDSAARDILGLKPQK